MANRTVLDCRFVACATCKYWQGNVTYNYPGTITIDQDNDTKGSCNNTYFGANTDAFTSCINWEQRFK